MPGKTPIAIAACAILILTVVGWLSMRHDVDASTPNISQPLPQKPPQPTRSEAILDQRGPPGPALGDAGVATSDTQSDSTAPPIPPGIHVIPLDQQQLPDDIKQSILAEVKNLRDTGSTSGGKKTHEFAHFDYFAQQLQNKGFDQLVRELGITPTNLFAALGSEWMLIGADVLSKQVTGLGWSGFAQVFQLQHGHGVVELSEMQYDVLAGDGAVISPEVFNGKVGPHPAMVERVTDDDGSEVFTFTWFVQDRRFSLSSKHLPQERVAAVAQRISQAHLAMPHHGWKQPYEYDENNASHRFAKLRMEELQRKAPDAKR